MVKPVKASEAQPAQQSPKVKGGKKGKKESAPSGIAENGTSTLQSLGGKNASKRKKDTKSAAATQPKAKKADKKEAVKKQETLELSQLLKNDLGWMVDRVHETFRPPGGWFQDSRVLAGVKGLMEELEKSEAVARLKEESIKTPGLRKEYVKYITSQEDVARKAKEAHGHVKGLMERNAKTSWPPLIGSFIEGKIARGIQKSKEQGVFAEMVEMICSVNSNLSEDRVHGLVNEKKYHELTWSVISFELN